MEQDELSIRQSITLSPNDMTIIEGAMEVIHTTKLSTAIQFIIRDWAKKSSDQEQDRAGSLKPPTNPLKRKQSTN